MSSKLYSKVFPVVGMSCAGCVASVEKVLNNQQEVSKAEVNFATKKVNIEYFGTESPDKLKEALNAVGFDIIIDKQKTEKEQEKRLENDLKDLRINTFWSFVLSIPVFVFGMLFMDWIPGQFISFVLSGIVLFWFGKQYFINAYNLATRSTANMDTLVALSTGIAFVFSTFTLFYPEFWIKRNLPSHIYFEASTLIITFVGFGKYFEEKAKANTSSAIKSLMTLQPKLVTLIENNREEQISIEQVEKGMQVLVKPGESIPVDGRVVSGHSFVNESMLTGEPISIEKYENEKVYSGTINQKGRLIVLTESVGELSRLGQIIRTVEKAQGSKAPVQKLVDKIAKYFVPVVMAIALLTFTTWILIGGNSFLSHAVLSAVTVLVIACPCALGLATPTAIMVGIGKGAKNGILIRDAESLEIGNKISAVVLDKTGTLTEGKPEVTDVYYSNESLHNSVLEALVSIESQSSHPLADSIVSFLSNIKGKIEQVSNFETIIGKGVKAKYSGAEFIIGNITLLKDEGIVVNEDFQSASDAYSEEGKSLVFVVSNSNLISVYAISDTVKKSSKNAILALKEMGVKVFMLTGDNKIAAEFMAKECGIDSIKHNQLPSDKSRFIKQLQQNGEVVAMVGDGINDTEALAVADLSIAIGEGSDIAMEVAQITLLNSDLKSIPKAIKLSQLTVNGIRQNLFWAFVYNIIGIPIAAGILYPSFGFLLSPMIAGGAMAFSSVSVVLNSLRLNNKRLI